MTQSSTGLLANVRAVFASLTFRFVLRFAIGLSLAVFLVMIALYGWGSYRFYAQNEHLVGRYLDDLSARFVHDGHLGDVHFEPDGTIGRMRYLLVDAEGRKVQGDFDEWPRDMLHSWWDLKQRTRFTGQATGVPLILGKARNLPGGYRLLVARSYDEILVMERVINDFMVRSMIVTIVLGALSGLVMATRSLRSISRINESISRIISGNLSERIPVAHSRGDYRALVMHFNQLLDRIQALMEGMRQVTDNVAHDLRTPLTRIRNHLASLQQTVEPPTRDTVHSLLHEADSLLATFNALLRIAQVESGQRRSGFRCVDLQVILADLIELYEPLAMEKQQALVANIPGMLPVVGDRDLLFQAFANLLDNAIKYTPAEGSIRLRSWQAEDGRSVVELADTGEGIPEADREKVFRRFYRVEVSRGTQPGNGLGLSLVKAVVSLHRAQIELADGAPGLVVRITLPAPPEMLTRAAANG